MPVCERQGLYSWRQRCGVSDCEPHTIMLHPSVFTANVHLSLNCRRIKHNSPELLYTLAW